MTRQIKCPVCHKPTAWDKNPWRPFCSERCKIIDFGDWANEQHFIPGDSKSPQEDDEDHPS